MQDVEQGEPQSQVLFRVTFLQCITLARQTLHHKSATYQQRHHEAARLPDLRRGGRLRGPPALPRGLPAGSAPESRPRPAPDDGDGTVPEETSVMPVVAAVRGITPVKPLPSHRPAAAAASGITPDRPRPSGLFRQDGRGRPSRRWRTACSEPVPAGRPGAAGPGSTGAAWGAAWGVCAMSPTRTPAVATTRPAGGYPGPDGARGSPVMTCPNRLLTCCKRPGAAGSAGVIVGDGPDGVGNGSGAPLPTPPHRSSRMVGRRLACRDAAGPRARHLTREHVC